MNGNIFSLVFARIILTILSLGFIFLTASATCNECSFSSTDCSELWLNVNAVEVTAGENTYQTFLLHNYGSERFFLDRVYAFDSDADILTEETSHDFYVKPGETAKIQIRVLANPDAKEKSTYAFIEFRGHFLNGKECGYADSRKSFPVKITAKKKYSNCNGFELIVPDTITINGKERIKFFVSNLSNETAIIRLEGNDISLSTNYFYVPAGVETEKEALLESTLDKTWLEFKVELGECSIPSRFTKIVKPAFMGEIEISYSKQWTNNAFNILVTVKNNSTEEKSGLISMDLPDNWKLEGDGDISVPAKSEKTFTLKAIPPNGFKEKAKGTIIVSMSGEIKEKEIEFEPSEVSSNAIGAAFIVFGGSALLIGLIVAALVAVALLLPRKQVPTVDPWETTRKPKQ